MMCNCIFTYFKVIDIQEKWFWNFWGDLVLKCARKYLKKYIEIYIEIYINTLTVACAIEFSMTGIFK